MQFTPMYKCLITTHSSVIYIPMTPIPVCHQETMLLLLPRLVFHHTEINPLVSIDISQQKIHRNTPHLVSSSRLGYPSLTGFFFPRGDCPNRLKCQGQLFSHMLGTSPKPLGMDVETILPGVRNEDRFTELSAGK